MPKQSRIYVLFFLLFLSLSFSGCLKNLPQKDLQPIGEPPAVDEISGRLDDTDQIPAVEGTPNTMGAGNAIPAGITYEDPWQYCLAAVTVNAPGEEYTGSPSPEAIRESVFRMLMIAEADRPSHNVIWRCLDGQVMGCDATASQDCLTSYSLDQTPSSAAVEECAKPDMEGIVLPAAVAGRETPYEWSCVNGEPTITGQGISIDEQGFNLLIWFPVMKP